MKFPFAPFFLRHESPLKIVRENRSAFNSLFFEGVSQIGLGIKKKRALLSHDDFNFFLSRSVCRKLPFASKVRLSHIGNDREEIIHTPVCFNNVGPGSHL